jgi:hypothetical protein
VIDEYLGVNRIPNNDKEDRGNRGNRGKGQV